MEEEVSHVSNMVDNQNKQGESTQADLTTIMQLLNNITGRLGDVNAKVTNNQSELKTLIDTKTKKINDDLHLEVAQI